MNLLIPGPQEPSSQLVHAFVKFLGQFKGRQQVSWQCPKNRVHEFSPSTKIEKLTLPPREFPGSPINERLQVDHLKPTKRYMKPKISDWKG
jgi:hypothetical protein